MGPELKELKDVEVVDKKEKTVADNAQTGREVIKKEDHVEVRCGTKEFEEGCMEEEG